MTDAELQAQYQRAMQRPGGPGAQCPSPEQLQRLVDRVGPEEERLETLDHAMSCPDCHRELALLHAIHAAEPRQALLKPRHWLAAASLLIVLAGGTLLSRGLVGHRSPEPMRGLDNASQGEGVTVVAATAGVASGHPGALTWHRVPGAVQYSVEVLDADDHAVFTSNTADTVVAVPALTAPVAWWVRAILPDGTDRRSAIIRLDNNK
jgi:hypothetical protein